MIDAMQVGRASALGKAESVGRAPMAVVSGLGTGNKKPFAGMNRKVVGVMACVTMLAIAALAGCSSSSPQASHQADSTKNAQQPARTSSPTTRTSEPEATTVPTTAASGTSTASTPATTPTTAAESSAATAGPLPSVVANCEMSAGAANAAATEPPAIDLACADGGLSFSDLSWTSWTSRSAEGTGQLSENDCTPDCADGTVHQFEASVTLTGVVNSIKGPVFSIINASYPNGGPNGEASGTFSLPVPPTPSPICTASQVQPWVSPENTYGLFSSVDIQFTNVSSEECHMEGYPGFDLLDGSGTSIVNAGRGCPWALGAYCTTTSTYAGLSAHGGTAMFQLAWQSTPQPGQTCPESASAAVTPPNAFDHLTIPLQIAVCGDPLNLGLGTVWSNS